MTDEAKTEQQAAVDGITDRYAYCAGEGYTEASAAVMSVGEALVPILLDIRDALAGIEMNTRKSQ